MNKANPYQQTFYCIYQTEDSISSDNPQTLKPSEVDSLIEPIGACHKNFIGFIDEAETTLQFYVDGIDDIWVEIPIVEKNGSYGKSISMVEMQSIIKNLEPPFLDYKTKLELSFKGW